jgi:hypothetical protein
MKLGLRKYYPDINFYTHLENNSPLLSDAIWENVDSYNFVIELSNKNSNIPYSCSSYIKC